VHLRDRRCGVEVDGRLLATECIPQYADVFRFRWAVEVRAEPGLFSRYVLQRCAASTAEIVAAVTGR
jgi:hypothetical protein